MTTITIQLHINNIRVPMSILQVMPIHLQRKISMEESITMTAEPIVHSKISAIFQNKNIFNLTDRINPAKAQGIQIGKFNKKTILIKSILTIINTMNTPTNLIWMSLIITDKINTHRKTTFLSIYHMTKMMDMIIISAISSQNQMWSMTNKVCKSRNINKNVYKILIKKVNQIINTQTQMINRRKQSKKALTKR